MSSSQRVVWTDENSRNLLKLCLEDQTRENSKLNWERLVLNLTAKCGKLFTVKQVKNHYGDLRMKFKAWQELENLTGMSFHPITDAPQLEECNLERWGDFERRYLKKFGASFLKTKLKNLDMLRDLFNGQLATGERAFSTAMGRSESYLTKKVNDLELSKGEGSGDSDDLIDGDDGIGCHDHISIQESRSPPISPPRATSSLKRKSDISTGTSHKRRQIDEVEKAYDVLKMANVPIPTKYDRCVAVFKEMGLQKERGDTYYIEALKLLGTDDRADLFLALDNNNHRFMYLDGELKFPFSDECYKPQQD